MTEQTKIENEEVNPFPILRKLVADAHFNNPEIAGIVAKFLNQMEADCTYAGMEWSDDIESYIEEALNVLSEDIEELQSEEEEEEIEELEEEEEEEEIEALEEEEDEEENEDEEDDEIIELNEDDLEDDDEPVSGENGQHI